MKKSTVYVLSFFTLACSLRVSPLGAVEPADAPPMAGRPHYFDGAVGSFHVSMKARPTELRAEETLILTIHVRSEAPSAKAPRRPNLGRRPAFAERFFLERNSNELPDRAGPDQQSWEFDYRLRPKNANVKSIPNFRFDFFKPGFLPADRGYQASWAYAIPLQVKPAEVLQLAGKEEKAELPALGAPTHEEATASPVLRKHSIRRMPGLGLNLFALCGVPVACVLFFVLCRHWFPVVERKAQQTRAARQALRALGRLRASSSEDSVRRVAAIMAEYLRDKLALRTDELSPAELKCQMETTGCPREITEQITAFFRAAALVCYGPTDPVVAADWPAEARRLILALEEVP